MIVLKLFLSPSFYHFSFSHFDFLLFSLSIEFFKVLQLIVTFLFNYVAIGKQDWLLTIRGSLFVSLFILLQTRIPKASHAKQNISLAFKSIRFFLFLLILLIRHMYNWYSKYDLIEYFQKKMLRFAFTVVCLVQMVNDFSMHTFLFITKFCGRISTFMSLQSCSY